MRSGGGGEKGERGAGVEWEESAAVGGEGED